MPPEADGEVGVDQRDIEGPLVDWQEKGHVVTLAGREAIDGREAFKLELKLKGGTTRYDYVDVASHQVVRSDVPRLVRGHATVLENRFSDFREVGGIVFPHAIETHVKDRPQVLRIAVEKIELDPVLDEARFRMPQLELAAARSGCPFGRSRCRRSRLCRRCHDGPLTQVEDRSTHRRRRKSGQGDEMKLHKQMTLGATSLALLLAGCATTTFTSIWKAPDAQPLQFKAGDKVVAMVVADSTGLRRSGEANLADELDKRGLKGIPAYTLIPDADIKDEAKAKAAIEASGAVGVILMRPMGKEQEISSTPSTYYGGAYYGRPGYGGMWGGGYYGYGWGGGVYDPGTIRTDTYVSIETVIYDLRQNKLVWAGQTKTMNPSDVEGFVTELATAVSKELRESGMVAGK